MFSKKKKVFKNFFQAISSKKRLLKFFSGVLQNFNNSKKSAVLEPRTGQFSRTWGLEAKAKDLTFEAKDFKMCPRGHPSILGAPTKSARIQKHSKNGNFCFQFKCLQRIYAKVVFLVYMRSNLAKKIQSHPSIYRWGEQLKRISFFSLKCWSAICNSKKNIKDNFLNLLCALPWVILSADCSAIVFLHVIFNVTFASFQILDIQ